MCPGAKQQPPDGLKGWFISSLFALLPVPSWRLTFVSCFTLDLLILRNQTYFLCRWATWHLRQGANPLPEFPRCCDSILRNAEGASRFFLGGMRGELKTETRCSGSVKWLPCLLCKRLQWCEWLGAKLALCCWFPCSAG